MYRTSSDVDFLKTGKVIIDADGIPVDLSVPLRLDTTVGTRVFAGDTMIYGDTGWRDIKDLLLPNWGTDPSSHLKCHIIRTNNVVTLVGRVSYIRVDNEPVHMKNSTISLLTNLPTGFTLAHPFATNGISSYYAAATRSTPDDMGIVTGPSIPRFIFPSRNESWFEGQAISFSITWETNSGWPNTLPGLPA